MKWLNGINDSKDPITYDGNWKNDLMNGKGTIKGIEEPSFLFWTGMWKKNNRKRGKSMGDIPIEDAYMTE